MPWSAVALGPLSMSWCVQAALPLPPQHIQPLLFPLHLATDTCTLLRLRLPLPLMLPLMLLMLLMLLLLLARSTRRPREAWDRT